MARVVDWDCGGDATFGNCLGWHVCRDNFGVIFVIFRCKCVSLQPCNEFGVAILFFGVSFFGPPSGFGVLSLSISLSDSKLAPLEVSRGAVAALGPVAVAAKPKYDFKQHTSAAVGIGLWPV